jgi:hypothetical protein
MQLYEGQIVLSTGTAWIVTKRNFTVQEPGKKCYMKWCRKLAGAWIKGAKYFGSLLLGFVKFYKILKSN